MSNRTVQAAAEGLPNACHPVVLSQADERSTVNRREVLSVLTTAVAMTAMARSPATQTLATFDRPFRLPSQKFGREGMYIFDLPQHPGTKFALWAKRHSEGRIAISREPESVVLGCVSDAEFDAGCCGFFQAVTA